MLRINQWIIQDSSDLLSDIHSRQWVVATGSFSMCLDTNISIKPHLSSAIGHRAPLTVMFYYLTNATYSYRVARCYGSSLAPMMPVVPSLPHSRSAFSYCLAVCWKPNVNVHILPKDNPVLCFIRSYNTPVAIRLSSRIGFIFNSARWVNRPTSMINTAVAIT